MGKALVGLDISPEERVFGYTDSSPARYARNASLISGTYPLYQFYLQHTSSYQAQAKTGTVRELIQLLEAYLIRASLRNTQTRSGTYEDVTYAAKTYWEANPDGFDWPESTPVGGAWGLLGSLAYYYFHYGVVSYPGTPMGYVAGALDLYYDYIEVDGSTPKARWEAIKTKIGWQKLPYKKVEALLEARLRSGDKDLQRVWLHSEHWQSLERKLVLGTLSPTLLTYLLANTGEIQQELDVENLSFNWPLEGRLALGPGGVPEALYALGLEGMLAYSLKLYEIEQAQEGLSFQELLTAEARKENRKQLAEALVTAYDAWDYLGELYTEGSQLRYHLYSLLALLIKADHSLAADLDSRVDGRDIDLEDMILQSNYETPAVSDATLSSFAQVSASEVAPDQLDVVTPAGLPATVETGSLQFLNFTARPGVAVGLKANTLYADVQVYSRNAVAGKDGKGSIAFVAFNLSPSPARVFIEVFILELPSRTYRVSTTVMGTTVDINKVLQSLPEITLTELPFERIVSRETQVFQEQHRVEETLLEHSKPAGGGQSGGNNPNSNMMGMLSKGMALFSQLLGKNGPTDFQPDKEGWQAAEKRKYATAACVQDVCEKQSTRLKEVEKETKDQAEKVAVGTMPQEITKVETQVNPDAGQQIVATTAAAAVNMAGGQTIQTSNEIWQVNAQHTRVASGARTDILSPSTNLTGQQLIIQCRHVHGQHDYYQQTVQYNWQRVTKQRFVLSENNLDYNNMWYKATSANAHYVAGHHLQYGDELIQIVGQTKGEDTKDAEKGEEDLEQIEVEEGANVPEAAEATAASTTTAVTNTASTVSSATSQMTSNLNTVQQAIGKVVQGNGFMNQIMTVLQNGGALGTITGALGSVFGGSGALGSALNTASSAITQVNSALNSVTTALQQIEALKSTLAGLQANAAVQQAIIDDPTSTPQQVIDATAELAVITAQIASVTTSAEQTLTSAVNTAASQINSQTSSLNSVVGTASSAIQTLASLFGAGGSFSGAGGVSQLLTKAAPFLSVIAGGGISSLSSLTSGLSALTGPLTGQIGSLTGALTSALGAFGIPGAAGITATVQNAVGAFTDGLGGLAGLGAGLPGVGADLVALGMANMPKLHKENSQTQKYGHYLNQTYKEIAFEVKQGGYALKVKKDMTFSTNTGTFAAKAFRINLAATRDIDLSSRAKATIRGKITTVAATKVLYLDAPKIIFSTKPIIGGVPGAGSAVSMLSQIQAAVDQMKQLMDYVQQAMSALGLGDNGVAQEMTSPKPVQTSSAPPPSGQRQVLDKANPGPGGNPPGTQAPGPPETNPMKDMAQIFSGEQTA